MYQSIQASGTLLSRASLANAARAGVTAAAEQVSFTSMPSFLKWPEYAVGAAKYVGITSRAWAYEQALANSWRGTEAVAAMVTAYQLGEGGYKLGSGTFFADTLRQRHDDPDQRRFEGILRRSLQQVESFEVSHREITVRRNLRIRYGIQAESIATRAYMEILNRINAEESDFWYTIGIGYIVTSKSEFAGAVDQAGLIYYRAMQTGNGEMIDLAATEIEDIDKAIGRIDTLVEALRGELAGPDVRKLTIEITEELHVRDDGVGEISLTFSQPLTDAPKVKIGAGPVVAYDLNANPSDGQPLPEIDGAVSAEMQGQEKQWTGTFPLKPLQKFVDSGDALPIEVIARDAAGRALDANPRSAARRRPGQRNWYYNEPDFETSVLGQGGPDRWHELMPRFEGGTSYVFVIDASGSMDDNQRMVQVKRSARSFLGNMTDRDEVAVIAFFDCTDIQVLQAFTRDRVAALGVIDALEPQSDTPLAKAILDGGDYLLERGHYDKRALIVLTDGEESCDGDPVAAAALFRHQATILGDVTNSRASNDPAEDEPDAVPAEREETEEAPPEEKVAARPDDRDAWNVVVSDGGLFPTISIVRTHFREWEVDDGCIAQVTEEVNYAYYGKVWQPDGSSRTGFGINGRAKKERTLDFAACSSGQARMDAIRSRWASLDGVTYDTARAQANERAIEALSP
jgi:Mg-chelatase subunit ChlD